MSVTILAGSNERMAVLTASALLATAGFLASLFLPSPAAALFGFLLVGAGLSNIAPILFTLTGRTRRIPANLAVASVLTVGYVGIIAGPAAIGLIAHATSLQTAFFFSAPRCWSSRYRREASSIASEPRPNRNEP